MRQLSGADKGWQGGKGGQATTSTTGTDSAAAATAAGAAPAPQRSCSSSVLENLLYIVPVAVVVSLCVGTAVYVKLNKWPVSLSLYYATQVLFGCNFGVPTEPSSDSPYFTLGLYLWGSTVFAGTVGAFASHLVSHASLVSKDERTKLRALQGGGGGGLGGGGLGGGAESILHSQTLFEQRMQLASVGAALLWLLAGTWIWSFFERESVADAAFFALGAMSTAGFPAPVCFPQPDDGGAADDAIDCWLGPSQSLLLALYIAVGAPLFTFAFGQFALSIVERAIRADEQKVLERPLTAQEFQLLRSLQLEAGEGGGEEGGGGGGGGGGGAGGRGRGRGRKGGGRGRAVRPVAHGLHRARGHPPAEDRRGGPRGHPRRLLHNAGGAGSRWWRGGGRR